MCFTGFISLNLSVVTCQTPQISSSFMKVKEKLNDEVPRLEISQFVETLIPQWWAPFQRMWKTDSLFWINRDNWILIICRCHTQHILTQNLIINKHNVSFKNCAYFRNWKCVLYIFWGQETTFLDPLILHSWGSVVFFFLLLLIIYLEPLS